MSAGSYVAVFERGGSGPTLIKRDQMQGHEHLLPQLAYAYGSTSLPVFGTSGTIGTNKSGGIVNDGVNGTPRVGTETYPTHATGAWMTRLFGVITPLGSAEAASLSTAYASLAARTASAESKNFSVRRRGADSSIAVRWQHQRRAQSGRGSCNSRKIWQRPHGHLHYSKARCFLHGHSNYRAWGWHDQLGADRSNG